VKFRDFLDFYPRSLTNRYIDAFLHILQYAAAQKQGLRDTWRLVNLAVHRH
jgi:hypothetical protein